MPPGLLSRAWALSVQAGSPAAAPRLRSEPVHAALATPAKCSGPLQLGRAPVPSMRRPLEELLIALRKVRPTVTAHALVHRVKRQGCWGLQDPRGAVRAHDALLCNQHQRRREPPRLAWPPVAPVPQILSSRAWSDT